MNLNEYQTLSTRTLPKGNRLNNLSNYAMGLCGESGEVTDELKKVIYHGHDLNVEKIENGLGDVLHYLSGLASMLELSLEDVARKNIEKLKERYPDGFTEERSRNRVV